MRRVTRGLAFLSALLATFAFAVPASAAEGRTVKGVLVSVSTTAVAVKNTKNVVTTCAVVATSPALDGYAAGDRVQATCARSGDKLVLAKIRLLAAQSSPSNDGKPTTFAGAVTALSDSSIALHDGDRDLVCAIGPSSPPTAGVRVGQHVGVSCSNGVLVALAPVTSGDTGRAYEGTLIAVSATSITVHTGRGDGTCSVGPGSPSLADVKVGDRVLAGCKTGTTQLVFLKKLAAGGDAPAGGTHKTIGAAGTVSALSSTALTVHTDGGEVSCTIGDGSPSVANLHVGDKVKMSCVDGVLKALLA
jgi:hypothetical protein